MGRLIFGLGLLLLGGCYNPSVRNDGYACNPYDALACPDGYQCINGLCDDGSGHPPPQADMAMKPAPADDMAKAMPGPNDDMAHGMTPDMAQTPDMAKACGVLGSSCDKDTDCCSGMHCGTFSGLCKLN